MVGDPVKLALGLLSLFFDVIFMAQHYCLYNRQPESRKRSDAEVSSLHGLGYRVWV